MKPFSIFLMKNACAGLVGTLLFISGVLLLFLWTSLFDFIVASMLVLKPNSYTLDLWRVPPMPIFLDFYFFNWTNPEDIFNATTKPKFRQMGPYRFREHREKVNLTWNANNTVTYRLLRYWYFDEEQSAGKLSDEVTTLNAVTMSGAHHVRYWSYIMKTGFSLSLGAIAPQVHITKPAGQLLFEGYEDPYVDMARALPFLADTIPPFDRFGWFYTRNASYTFDGVFNMATGVENQLGELRSWNYESETSYYGGSCAKVHGSAAELYPARLLRDHIGFFSPDMCRHVTLDYEQDVVVKNIKGYKFSAQHGMLDNGTRVPENECYCNGDCVPSGMLNVSSCRYGTPAFVSLPHFYGADPMYLSKVEGLQPEQSKHELFIALEPRTGVPLDVAIRLQLNIRMQPVEDISLYQEVPDMFFPMLWFEQKVSTPNDIAWMMRLLLSSSTTFPILASTLMVGGVLLMIFVCRRLTVKLIKEKMHTQVPISREEMPLRATLDDIYVPSKRKLKRQIL